MITGLLLSVAVVVLVAVLVFGWQWGRRMQRRVHRLEQLAVGLDIIDQATGTTGRPPNGHNGHNGSTDRRYLRLIKGGAVVAFLLGLGAWARRHQVVATLAAVGVSGVLTVAAIGLDDGQPQGPPRARPHHTIAAPVVPPPKRKRKVRPPSGRPSSPAGAQPPSPTTAAPTADQASTMPAGWPSTTAPTTGPTSSAPTPTASGPATSSPPGRPPAPVCLQVIVIRLCL